MSYLSLGKRGSLTHITMEKRVALHVLSMHLKFLSDVGLLGAQSSLSPRFIIEGNLLFSEFKGALTENFIAQELITAHKRKLYYWKSAGIAEVDFLLEHDHDIYPLEVKAGENKRKKVLLLITPKLLYRAALMNLKATGNFVNYPLCMASLIDKTV